jgi:hypothetical protein
LPKLEPQHMTAEEQHRVQTELDADGPPRDDITGHGPWYRDGDSWHIDRSLTKK